MIDKKLISLIGIVLAVGLFYLLSKPKENKKETPVELGESPINICQCNPNMLAGDRRCCASPIEIPVNICPCDPNMLAGDRRCCTSLPSPPPVVPPLPLEPITPPSPPEPIPFLTTAKILSVTPQKTIYYAGENVTADMTVLNTGTNNITSEKITLSIDVKLKDWFAQMAWNTASPEKRKAVILSIIGSDTFYFNAFIKPSKTSILTATVPTAKKINIFSAAGDYTITFALYINGQYADSYSATFALYA